MRTGSQNFSRLLPAGLAGYFLPAQQVVGDEDILAMGKLFSAPVRHQCGPAHLMAAISTEELHDRDRQIICTIVGSPRWTDSQLARVAQEHGNAAALERAYDRLGETFPQVLQGSFACLVLDFPRKRAVAAIDKLGQHQLYFMEVDEGIAIGSAAAAVLAHPRTERQIDPQGIYNYVYFHMVPAPGTIYSGLRKLRAAETLIWELGEIRTQNYWTPPFGKHNHDGAGILGADLKMRLKKAVQHSLGEPGSTGCFLSGGSDSSTVAGVLSELSPTKAQAFSIGFSAQGYDEMEYARTTARHFNMDLHEYYVSEEDVVSALPITAAAYDEPFGNSSAIPTYFCAKLANEAGISHLLAGDGGDELFAGNERYARQKIFELYHRFPQTLRSGVIEPVTRHIPEWPLLGKIRSYVEQARVPLPDRMQTYNFLHRMSPVDVFAPDFLASIDDNVPLSLQQYIYSLPQEASMLDRMLFLDWQYTLSDNDLRKVTQMCALGKVDVAFPMLDDDLVDFSCSVPDSLKLRGFDLRYFYKKSLTGWLPDATIHKSKQGFGLPFGVWMKTHPGLQELTKSLINQLKKREYFQEAFLDNAMAMHANSHAAYYGELLWVLAVLEVWLQKTSVV